jgi:hypothetical protein
MGRTAYSSANRAYPFRRDAGAESEAQGAALTACAAITGRRPTGESRWAASVSLGRAQDSTIGGGFLALVRGI